MNRVVNWFSCGAASAVASKLALEKYRATHEVVIARIYLSSEHPDNDRFCRDCIRWFNWDIYNLQSEKYEDVWEVFEKRRFLTGPKGALCTVEMKKKVRFEFQEVDDIQVFGFTIEEKARAERFRDQNPDVILCTPLIDEGLGKEDCFRIIEEAGIALPVMYQLGYMNNNCIGCVKGKKGYWNKIRKDFPEVFARMAKVERTLGRTINRNKDKSPLFLDELDPAEGRYGREKKMSCDFLCSDENT